MRNVLIGVLLLVVPFVAVSAQEGSLPYVDIEAADARIAVLEQTNTDYETEISERIQTNSSLEAEIGGWQTQLVEIDPILARVSAELTDLFAVNRTIVDEQMKQRSQDAIGRARTIKRSLENTIRTLTQSTVTARAEIEGNRERIRILNSRIGANVEEIAYLQAAIVQTRAQQEKLDSYIVNVDSILSDAERYVQDDAAEE